MSAPEFKDGSRLSLDRAGHNASPQVGVVRNPDPALEYSNEHAHGHLHHSAAAMKGREEEVAYTKNTTDEPSTIPRPDQMDDVLHRRGLKDGAHVHDTEKGGFSPSATESEEDPRRHGLSTAYRSYKLYVHVFLWLIMTGWWIASLVLHRNDKNWLIPFLVYLLFSIRLLTLYVPITLVTRPMRWAWKNTGTRISDMVPKKLRAPLGALIVVAVYLIGGFVPQESQDNTRANRAISMFGLLVLIGGLYATSRNRSAIKWHTVIVGMLVQFIIAIFVLKSQAGYDIFSFISGLARDLLGFAGQGTAFLVSDDIFKAYSTVFVLNVIPAIIFFVAFVQLLYYWGWLQWAIGKFATFFFWSMRVSGAEAVVAAASPFIGQGESAMLIKPFVSHMTKAELHQVMTSGFATIAGSVLVAYIGFGVNPQALVSSCVMSIPASLAISKMRYPEEEETLTAGRVVIPDDDEHRAANSLHAFANGAWLGLKIAGMIVATLLCILALLGLVNGLLTWWGRYLDINDPPLTIQLIVGYICYPVAFLLGVGTDSQQLLLVGQLIGEKIIANEFVAYSDLVSPDKPYAAVLTPRSKLITTYALCGFGNIGSLGTQIGVLSQIAPGRGGDVSRLALSALAAGVLSTLSSASIAGMLVTDQAAFISTTAA